MELKLVRAIFSGGPANGQMLEIPDYPEYRFPVAPPITWNGTYSSDKANIQAASYRRTGLIDQQGCYIYEFTGIQ